MSVDFDALVAEVTDTESVIDSAIKVFDDLIAALSGQPTPAQVQAVVAGLKAKKDALATAIATTPTNPNPTA